MQYGQLHRRHHRRPSSAFIQERRPLPATPPAEPQPSIAEPQNRSRYRVVRVNGEWVVQIRQDNQN